MAKSKEHMILGAFVSSVVYVAAMHAQGKEANLGTAIGWGIVGAGVATLPDVLEPANSPNHRSSAHSLTTAGMISCAAKETWDRNDSSAEQKAAAASLAAAYLSHLLVDSGTRKGIPIL